MRVTDQMIFERAATSAGSARARAQKASQEVSSGMRVQHPWDAPAAAGQLVRSQLNQARMTTIASTASQAMDELDAADTALDGVQNAVIRARELAMQLASGTYNAQDRANAAQEVDGLFKQSVALLNSDVGGRFIFGGRADGAPPFDPVGAYSGDSGIRQVETAPGVTTQASVQADVAVKGVGGGVDVLQTLASLRTALQVNDVPGIQASLTGLSTGVTQLSTARTQAGNGSSLLQLASNVARIAVLQEQTQASHLGDADILDATSRLAMAQRVLEATLTASATTFKGTLLDHLR